MPLAQTKKAEIIKKFQRHEKDCSSMNVQIAFLTERINSLTEHFKKNTQDYHSRTGLMKIVGRRRKYLSYLKSKNLGEYKTLISELGLRK